MFVILNRYADKAESIFHLDTYSDKASLMRAIKGVRYIAGYTNTSGGLRVMMEDQFTQRRGDRSDVANIAILMTDGKANRDEYRTIKDAEIARSSGISIFTVGISGNVDEDEIRSISSIPQKQNYNYFLAPDFKALQTLRDLVGEEVCNAIGKIIL